MEYKKKNGNNAYKKKDEEKYRYVEIMFISMKHKKSIVNNFFNFTTCFTNNVCILLVFNMFLHHFYDFNPG